MSLEKKDGEEVDKINGERVEEIMRLLDESGKQRREINTAKMGATLKHLYNEKMTNFRCSYNQALVLFGELKEEDPNYKINYPKMCSKLNLTIEEFYGFEK